MKLKDYQEKRVDEILDKILSQGFGSLTKTELEYLDAFSKGDTMKMINIDYNSQLKNFKSIDGKFKFKFSHKIRYEENDSECFFGTMIVPDLVLNKKKISGELEGYIMVLPNNDKLPFFDKDGYDIIDFCAGIEYELDNFIDYVVDTIREEEK